MEFNNYTFHNNKYRSFGEETKDDIWLEYPLKKTGKARILYNDAVEEALCFGWIDSTVKSLNEDTAEKQRLININSS